MMQQVEIEEDNYEESVSRRFRNATPGSRRSRATQVERTFSQIMKDDNLYGEDVGV